jgi:uncharacterized tellurite resistance protein B-like protein
MHILAGLMTIIGAVAFFIIRAGMIARAGSELGDAASTAVGAVRRARFRKKATRSPLTQLDDPREGVAALMVAIAKAEGDLTEQQVSAMASLARDRLEEEDPEELIAHARWLTQDAVEPGIVVQRVSRFLAKQCSLDQKHDIIEILNKVAAIGSPATPLQMQAIARLMHNLDIRKPLDTV